MFFQHLFSLEKLIKCEPPIFVEDDTSAEPTNIFELFFNIVFNTSPLIARVEFLLSEKFCCLNQSSCISNLLLKH